MAIARAEHEELALQLRRDHARRYLDIAGVVIVVLDTALRVALLNRKGCELLGVSEEDALGRNWFDEFVPEAGREEQRALYAAFLGGQHETSQGMETAVLTSRGGTRLVDWHHTLVRDDAGAVIGGLSSGAEGGAGRAAERRLSEFRTLLEATAEASPDGIMVSDPKGKYLFWNKRYKEMWRLSDDYIRLRQSGPPISAELLKPFTDQLVVPEGFVDNSLDILQAGRLPAPRTDELHFKDGRVVIRYAAQVSAGTLPFSAVAWVYRDITEQRQQAEAAYRAIEEVSLTDPLTGMRNRRFLQQYMDADVALTLRHYEQWLRRPTQPLPATADMIFYLVDLDHFKAVNDRYGHAVGDQALVEMHHRLKEVFRASDHLVRWGGEEFLVVARAVNRSEAQGMAERVREVVGGSPFELGDGLSLTATCSVGFACFPFLPAHPRLIAWSQVVELADRGLYLAKRGGRNAWVGLFSAERTRPERLFQRLTLAPADALRSGELQLVTSLADVGDAAWPGA